MSELVTKIEEGGASTGAMLPVVQPTGTLSKNTTMSNESIDADFGAINILKSKVGGTSVPDVGEDESLNGGVKKEMYHVNDTATEVSKLDEGEQLKDLTTPFTEDIKKLNRELDTSIEGFNESGEENVFFESDDEMFEESGAKIDADIRPIIKKLNEKGYKTRYSCSGHPSARFEKDVYRDGILNGKLYSTARIVFDAVYPFPSIPEGWRKRILNRDEENECSAIYVRPPRFHIINGLPPKQYKNWKARYMYHLEKWADELPSLAEAKEETDELLTVESVIDDIIIDSMA